MGLVRTLVQYAAGVHSAKKESHGMDAMRIKQAINEEEQNKNHSKTANVKH